MKCRDAHELINSYFDNKIDPMKDKLLAEHINSCPKCRAELDFLIKYKSILKSVKPVSPPENYMAELHRKIELGKSENPVKRIIDTLKIFLANYNFHIEAAGVLAVAALVFFLYRPFFSEKIPEKTAEYRIETPQSVTAPEKNMLKRAEKPDRIEQLKNAPSIKTESLPGEESFKDKTPASKTADDNISAEKKSGYDSDETVMMKKSRSLDSEKSTMKSEEKEYIAEDTDTKGAMSRKEYSAQSPDSDIEKILGDFNASIIKKDLSHSERLYYRVRIHSEKHNSLIKKLKDSFIVEEKTIKKSSTYYEIDFFLKHKKN